MNTRDRFTRVLRQQFRTYGLDCAWLPKGLNLRVSI